MSAEAVIRHSRRVSGDEPEYANVGTTLPMARRQTSRAGSQPRSTTQDPSQGDDEDEEDDGQEDQQGTPVVQQEDTDAFLQSEAASETDATPRASVPWKGKARAPESEDSDEDALRYMQLRNEWR